MRVRGVSAIVPACTARAAGDQPQRCCRPPPAPVTVGLPSRTGAVSWRLTSGGDRSWPRRSGSERRSGRRTDAGERPSGGAPPRGAGVRVPGWERSGGQPCRPLAPWRGPAGSGAGDGVGLGAVHGGRVRPAGRRRVPGAGQGRRGPAAGRAKPTAAGGGRGRGRDRRAQLVAVVGTARWPGRLLGIGGQPRPGARGAGRAGGRARSGKAGPPDRGRDVPRPGRLPTRPGGPSWAPGPGGRGHHCHPGLGEAGSGQRLEDPGHLASPALPPGGRPRPGGDGMTVGVVVDGGASLPEAARWPFRVVAMHAGPAAPGAPDPLTTTAAPSPGEFLEAIEAVDTGSGVVVVTVAGTLSASLEAARVAAGLAGTTSVVVVDSATATTGEGLVALAAARGRSLAEVAAAARETAQRIHLVGHLGDVGPVARRGRLRLPAGEAPGPGRAVVELVAGEVRIAGSASGFEPAQDQVVEAVAASMPPGARLHAGAFHGGRAEAAASLLATVQRLAPVETAFVAELSTVMLAHTGPDVCGLAWWWEEG